MDGHGRNADLLRRGRRGKTISVNVSTGYRRLCLIVPAHITFGELKNYIDQEFGLEPDRQRLLFEEMERDDQEYLDRVGVKDNAQVSLMEKEKTIERTFEEAEGSGSSSAAEVRVGEELGSVEVTVEDPLEKEKRKERKESRLKALTDLAEVRAEVDKLSEQVAALKGDVNGGTQAREKKIQKLTELLTRQLFKLDGIKAVEEGIQLPERMLEVYRVQSFVNTLDSLKGMNSNPLGNDSRNV